MAENNKKGEKSKEGVCLAFSFVYYVFLFLGILYKIILIFCSVCFMWWHDVDKY